MPVPNSLLSGILKLELDGGDFVLERDSQAFDGQFTSLELRAGPNTVIKTEEEVDHIFRRVVAALKQLTEIYQRYRKQVKLQLKLKVSWIPGGDVEESWTAMSVPMCGSSSIQQGVDKLVVELKRERVPQEGVPYTYFSLRVQIMTVSGTVSLKNSTPGDCEDEGLINTSLRMRRVLNFKHVGNKYPLDYVMFCSFEYEKIAYDNNQRATKSGQWRLHSKPSIAFIIDGPTDGKGIDTGGVHWLRGEDVIGKFIDEMSDLGADMVKNLDRKPKYDKKSGEKHKNEVDCCICDKPMGIDRGHIHHCHRTGHIFGKAHSICNSNYARKQSSLPVFVHCPDADDFRGLLISLFHNRGLKISSSKNDNGRERDEQVTLTLEGLPLVFLNARRFLPDSLQNLKNLDFIPQINLKRSNNWTSYFPEESLPRIAETTLLLADTISFVRERIQEKVKLDLCRYHTLNEFILDAILKTADTDLTLPDQLKGIVRPYPKTLETNIFELSDFGKTSLIVRAMGSHLPTSDFTPLPETEIKKFDSTFIDGLSDTAPIGYIFEITLDGKNSDRYFVHYILLKYLKGKYPDFEIQKIIQFKQTPFMNSFVSAFLDDAEFRLDKKLGQFFSENIIENTNMVKPRRASFKSVPAAEVEHFHELIKRDNFVTANCFAEDLVEVILSEKYKWYEFTFLSLALRDLIFTYSNESE